jgi:putative flippase GtrA
MIPTTVSILYLILSKKALRFAVSGFIVTSLHVLIASTFIEMVLPTAAIANGVAFIVSTIFSYFINTLWSFSSLLHKKNLIRFCLVSLIGLSLAMSLSALAQQYGLDYWYGIFLVVSFVPLVTFLLHNYWTYR